MARFKDFDAANAERKGEPITFRLGGREWAVDHVNAFNFLQFTRKVANGGFDVVIGFDDFINSSLRASQREEFRTMLAESEVGLDTLIAVGTFITEQASGNPLADASSSQPQQSKRGKRPKVVSLSQASTPEGSHSAAG